MNYFDVLFAKKLAYNPPLPPVIKRVTGNPIELTDAADAPMVKCVTQITGSQDLHGYDKPWVGGAGKNKLPTLNATQTINGIVWTLNDDGSVTLNGTATANSVYDFGRGTLHLTAGTYTTTLSDANVYVYVYENTTPTTFIAQGGGTFTIDHDADIFVRFWIDSGKTVNVTKYPQLESGSTATAYAPYSNICPITAYTEGGIVERGHNVSNEVYEPGYIDIYTGANATSNTTKRTVNYIKIQPNTQYCYVSSSANDVKIAFYGKDKSYVGYFGNNDSNPQIFTTPSNAYYLRYYIGNDSYAGVNYPKTVNTYESYKGSTHTTTYPSAIYRGSEDVVNGEVTTSLKIVDMGDIPWSYDSQYNYFSANLYDLKKYANNVMPDMYCECYAVINSRYGSAMGGVANGVICPRTGQSYIQVKETAYTDETQFRNSVTGMKIVYELATPTTSSVTPTNLPIKSLSGYNHIESSTGEMVIDYITDAYQNFVDTVESALPNTRKGGAKALDIFLSLEPQEKPETQKEEDAKTNIQEEK